MKQLEIFLKQINERKSQTDTVLYKGEVYNYYDEGLTRKVYVNDKGTKVIKLLIDDDRINHNQIEYDLFVSSNEQELLAHTEISDDGSIVEQEFVLPMKFSDRELTIPEILFAGKCRDEVGWNSQGKLVCFDLSEFKKY